MELREGLGFDLKPNERRCFYELLSDIDLNRNVEIFADGSNGANLALTVYGPIDKNDLLKVNSFSSSFYYSFLMQFFLSQSFSPSSITE